MIQILNVHADVSEKDSSSMENKCIVDCERDIGKFYLTIRDENKGKKVEIYLKNLQIVSETVPVRFLDVLTRVPVTVMFQWMSMFFPYRLLRHGF